jgi:hypothetical protein
LERCQDILVLNTRGINRRIDVIFVYNETSIKSAEWAKVVLGVLFTNISHGHKIHQWRKLLACSASKASLIKFLATDWQTEILRKRLGNKELYVTCDYMCI